MSYLFMANGIPDFSKAVISFWFRVQADTIQTVAREVAEEDRSPPLMNVIPLLVFGQMFKGYDIKTEPPEMSTQIETVKGFVGGVETVINTVEHAVSEGPPTVSKGDEFDQAPSFIGINCEFDQDTGEVTATLRIRFQTKNFGTGSWAYQVNSVHSSNYSSYANLSGPYSTGNARDVSQGVCNEQPDAGEPLVDTQTPIDKSEIYTGQQGPDSFEVGPAWAENPDDYMSIEPDKWHHLLLSFDLTNDTTGTGTTSFDAYGCDPQPVQTTSEIKAISNPCQIWIALDDKNRKGKALDDPRWGGADPDNRLVAGLGDNGIAPYYAIATTFQTSSGSSANDWFVTGTRRIVNFAMGDMPTYTYNGDDQVLPSQNQAFGIPGTPQLVARIRHCEMAEFQMWTDVTLDTNIESNRRAFIDKKGNPVDPNEHTESDPRGPGEKLLGKRPEILLHGDNNWQTGYNTGSLGIEIIADDTIIKNPTGQFTPVAKIEKYDPEPALGH